MAEVMQERAIPIDRLYTEYGRPAFALAYRVLGDPEAAEDVVQDAFLAVWRNAPTYERLGGNVRPWLMAVVRNRAIDVMRAGRSRPVNSAALDEAHYIPAENSDPAGQALRRVESVFLRNAVAALPPVQRETVELAFFAGLSYVEVAERMGAPLGTVKSRVRLALRRLHDRLTADDGRGWSMGLT
ncbi:MAG: RNA polymerase sigma factor [Geminicoccaceae bacterium]